jgi:hypothetical protein
VLKNENRMCGAAHANLQARLRRGQGWQVNGNTKTATVDMHAVLFGSLTSSCLN